MPGSEQIPSVASAMAPAPAAAPGAAPLLRLRDLQVRYPGAAAPTLDGLSQGDFQIHADVIAVAAINRMLANLDLNQRIAGRAIPSARQTLALQPQRLARREPSRNR